MNKKIITEIFVAIVIGVILIVTPKINKTEEKFINFNTTSIEETITIATFNIQIFGNSKSSKPEIMQQLADIVSEYDIIAIQEIRDKNGVVMPRFMEYLSGYKYIIGPRLGRTSSKEQYVYLYKEDTIELLSEYTYIDKNDVFEREPMSAYFKVKNGTFDFILSNIHIKPSDAENEIFNLSKIGSEIQLHFDEEDLIFLGDFNADGSYYNEENIQNLFKNYIVIITNDIDTTVAKSDNTYDRIIGFNTIREDYFSKFGVIEFTDKEISDHYLIWSEFYSFRDTD